MAVNEYQINAMKRKGIKPILTPDATEDDIQESLDRLNDYLVELPYAQRKLCFKAIETCQALGDSLCAIDYMIANRPQSNWDEYGYGLLFYPNYRNSCREDLGD